MKKAVSFSIIIAFSFICTLLKAEEPLQITGPENAATLTYQSLDEGRVLLSVLDKNAEPIRGLGSMDFSITRTGKTAKILSVEPLETSKEVPLNVVLVVDNSFSMKQRKAVQPLLQALEEFYGVVRPIDNIYAIVFDDRETILLNGKNLNSRTLQTNNIEALRGFFTGSFFDRLASGTYLYESMYLGMDMIRKMPEESNKFLLVFTDGQDINSTVRTSEVVEMAKGIPNFAAYALDFMEQETKDPFLLSFSETHDGRLWKAGSAEDLVPIINAFSTTLLHRYIVSYRFLNPPRGNLSLEPKRVVIEEVTTIDSSPLLNYVFFVAGQSDIPDQYVPLPKETGRSGFSESQLRGPMEKYRNVLNIIGKRLSENPGAGITITGCNSNLGQEKANLSLSRDRAEAVKSYLQLMWGIDRARMEVKARNLPQTPSTSSDPEGIAENQRVEIQSDDGLILDVIRSTYVEEMADTTSIRILPRIEAEAGIADWKVELKGDDEVVIESASGKGDMNPDFTFNLADTGLGRIASFQTLTASVEVTDNEGELFMEDSATSTNITFIRKEEMKAEKKGYRVIERYALILFEYDSAEIRENNKVIVDRIVARIKELSSVKTTIVGHTDTIGKEAYNVKLSQRRAKAVFDQIVAAGIRPDENLTYTGVGPHNPLYDNAAPEGRAMNRTVTVTLEYEEKG